MCAERRRRMVEETADQHYPVFKLPEESPRRYLKQAETVFQQELSHLPELARYRFPQVYGLRFSR